MIIGFDKGTTYCKTDRNLILRSTIRNYTEDEVMLNDSKNIVEYEGQKYIIGEKGNYSTDLMKAKHDNTKLLLLTCLGLSFEDEYIITNVVTGLPIGLYSTQKKEMENIIRTNEVYQIIINGFKKYIKVKDIKVFPEGAGAFYSQTSIKDALVVDIGGLSIDTALFENKKLTKYSTYSMGTMKLYSKIANYINSQYDLSLTEWDMEKVLNQGLSIYGQQVDLKLDFLIKDHIQEIIQRLKLEYDLKMIDNVLFTGGGSEWIYQYFKKDIPQSTIMNNAQFSNAIGYANIGKVVFK